MNMSCDNSQSLVLDAIIENGEVITTEGLVVPDAVHPYNNTNDGKPNGKPTGVGTGFLIQDVDGLIHFIMNNLNANVINMIQSFIDNLNFSAESTDLLAQEIALKLESIKNALKDQIKQIP